MGNIVSESGLKLDGEKVGAIIQMPSPQSKEDIAEILRNGQLLLPVYFQTVGNYCTIAITHKERSSMDLVARARTVIKKLTQMKSETAQDETLQELLKVVKSGWPSHRSKVPSLITHYWHLRGEVHEVEGLLLLDEKLNYFTRDETRCVELHS
ncbi:unnamed protein product [Porites evermanni]|uniref:Uncharacterized protein n=1 Tax=Porites evermanni TaxID=104178 RepID=A0ABN8MDV7_9CNID|nr:unnamed protein product [Porites evermanni]